MLHPRGFNQRPLHHSHIQLHRHSVPRLLFEQAPSSSRHAFSSVPGVVFAKEALSLGEFALPKEPPKQEIS